MAKDLTSMPTDKLFKRIEGAVAELQRRFVPVGDVLPRTQRVSPGIRVQADRYGPTLKHYSDGRTEQVEQTADGTTRRTMRDSSGVVESVRVSDINHDPEDDAQAAAATVQRRLHTSKRVPVSDPGYLAAFERTRARPATADDVRMADANGILAPVTTGEAE